jgi:pyruvate/2-oxoacid:ferredoxin oxidoreductase alpha subunit
VTLKGRNFKPFNDSEIDNTIDRYCIFDFEKNTQSKYFKVFKNDIRYVHKKAYIESSTIAYCESPPMVDDINTAFVEITLNFQDYSDD